MTVCAGEKGYPLSDPRKAPPPGLWQRTIWTGGGEQFEGDSNGQNLA